MKHLLTPSVLSVSFLLSVNYGADHQTTFDTNTPQRLTHHTEASPGAASSQASTVARTPQKEDILSSDSLPNRMTSADLRLIIRSHRALEAEHPTVAAANSALQSEVATLKNLIMF